MAPNNALADHKNKKPKPNGKQASTTVLDQGTVESRGMGTKATSRDVISAEIQAFLSGEAKFGWLSETRAFFTVWTFITRLPGPTWVDHHPGYLMRGMAYFPLGGALVGLFVAVFFDLAAAIGMPTAVAAAMSTAASFWVTGCFHEDGLADASDGIGGGWSRTEILRIMTDTRLGTYGCAVLLLYIVAKLELLAALGYSHWDVDGTFGAGPALLASHTLARVSSPFLIRTRDYVDEAGPKYKFYSFMVQAKHLVTWHRVVFAAVFSFGLVTVLYGLSSAVVLVSAVFLLSHAAGEYGEYILGGVMGDYLGATVCITELLVLSLILVLQKTDIVELVALFFVKLKDEKSLDEKLEVLWGDERFLAIFRWLCVMSVTVIWCSNVGHPPVLVRESVVAAAKRGDSEIRIKLTTPEERTNGVESSPRMKADKVCSSPSSTFEERYSAVQVYLDSLAKPVGSLGALEDWASRLAALQRTTKPIVDSVACLIFASDHGAAANSENGGEGCSAYPQAVTRSVLEGLECGVAGASVLAKANGVTLRVVDMGVNAEISPGDVVVVSDAKLVNGTRNFCLQPAMTTEESEACIRAGRTALIQYASETGAQAVVLGEVGIGNTTSSSLLTAALTGKPVETLCSGGAFLSKMVDETSVAKKISIVKKALALHGSSVNRPAAALAKLGGAEIAGLVGAILEASDRDIPVLIDGFIVTVAALIAASLCPNVCRVLFLTSQSAEKGQAAAIGNISLIAQENGISFQSAPILSMNMRMGEATAALLAVPILRSAAAVLSDMATIQEILESSC